MAGGRIWTNDEKLFLEENIGKKSLVQIGKKLNRTPGAVLTQADRMGIANTRDGADGYILNQICLATGVAMKTLKQWIKERGFPAKKKVTRLSKASYFVDPVKFWEWVKENPERINCYAIEKNSIIPEPDWVDERRKVDYYRQKKPPQEWTTKEEALLTDLLLEKKMSQGQAATYFPGRTKISIQRHWAIMRERDPELGDRYFEIHPGQARKGHQKML